MNLETTTTFWGETAIGGKLTSGKPYWHRFGAMLIEAKSGYGRSCGNYMSDVVQPCCWFCIQTCFPPARPRFSVGFCELCWLHLGSSKGYILATLMSSGGQLR